MFDILFPMHQFDFHTKFLIQVLCQMLGRINRTMLSAGATEADGQIAESAFHITLHGGIHQSIDMIEETEYFSIFFQESDYRFIQSGERFVTFIFSGNVYGTADENIPATVACGVVELSFFVGKTHNLHSELPFF